MGAAEGRRKFSQYIRPIEQPYSVEQIHPIKQPSFGFSAQSRRSGHYQPRYWNEVLGMSSTSSNSVMYWPSKAISFATDNGEVKPVTWQDSGVAQTFVPTRYYVENGVIVHGYTRPTDSSIPAKEEFKVDLHDSDALPHEYKTWLELLLKDAKDQIIQESSEKHWSNRRLVFTIPNNWEMSKRAGLAQAITNIKWVENAEHIKFLMESEAAVHYALNQHKLPELKVGAHPHRF